MVNNNAKPNACSVSLKIDTKILYLYRKWWWSGGGRRRKMQDNCIFLPRVKSRRCANILRCESFRLPWIFSYLVTFQSWQHSITTELTQRRKWRLHLQPGSSKMLYSRREERRQSTTGTSSMTRWIVERRDNTSGFMQNIGNLEWILTLTGRG